MPFSNPKGAAKFIHEKLGGDNPGGNSDRYAGTTDDVQSRLKAHEDLKTDRYAWVACSSKKIAQNAEEVLHDLGYQGALGDGNDDCVFVYAYVITPVTTEAPSRT
jgi:hypothetical protein